MNYSQYYNILGLPSTASAEEVKKAYRKLAAKYHPDVNSKGEQQFIIIKEAYEVLTNKKTVTTDRVTVTPQTSSTQRKSQTKEERIRAAKQKYWEDKKKEELENIRFYQKTINSKSFQFLKYGAFFACILAFLLILDETLPYQPKDTYEYVFTGDVKDIVHNELENNDYLLEIENPVQYKQDYTTQQTRIFNKEKIFKVNYQTPGTMDELNNQDTIWVLILLFLIPMFTVIYKRMSALFYLLFYSSIYIAIPTALITGIVHLLYLLEIT